MRTLSSNRCSPSSRSIERWASVKHMNFTSIPTHTNAANAAYMAFDCICLSLNTNEQSRAEWSYVVHWCVVIAWTTSKYTYSRQPNDQQEEKNRISISRLSSDLVQKVSQPRYTRRKRMCLWSAFHVHAVCVRPNKTAKWIFISEKIAFLQLNQTNWRQFGGYYSLGHWYAMFCQIISTDFDI